MGKWKLYERSGEIEFRVMLKSRRLAGMLAEVWQSIPMDERSVINDRLSLVTDAAAIRYVLSDANTYFQPGIFIYGAATGGNDTAPFVFLNADKLRYRPPYYVCFVIAHELAHIFHGHNQQSKRRKIYETEADATAARWGYPSEPKLTITMGASWEG